MGARGSREANSATVEEHREANSATVEEHREAIPDVPLESDPDVKDVVEAEPFEEHLEEIGQGAYEDALARCAELRRTRQELLRMRMQVSATVARFAPSFDDSDATHDSESQDEDTEDEQESDEDQTPQFQQKVDALTYQDVLARQEELEDEVDALRDMFEAAASMITGVAEKSLQLSEHLEEIENQLDLPRVSEELQTASDASSEHSTSDQVHAKLGSMEKEMDSLARMEAVKAKHHELKLPSLHLMMVPDMPGSQASSSTATPRSEKSSESRMASARSEKECDLVIA